TTHLGHAFRTDRRSRAGSRPGAGLRGARHRRVLEHRVLFERARALGVRWMTDLECAEAGAVGVRSFVEDFAHDLDVLYLTIDLDVLPAAVAPGVSAPAGL